MSEEQITRLEERLERERRARRQAEMIAERGMRDLWEVNRELQERVDVRTSQVARLLAGYERARAAWADEMADELEQLRLTLLPDGDPDDVFGRARDLGGFARRHLEDTPLTTNPASVSDDLLHRWQRPAARHGQLLVVEADAADADVVARWDCLVGLYEVVVNAIVHNCGAGMVTIRFHVDTETLATDLEFPGATGPAGCRALDAAFSIGRRLVSDAGGSSSEGHDGAFAARLPIGR